MCVGIEACVRLMEWAWHTHMRLSGCLAVYLAVLQHLSQFRVRVSKIKKVSMFDSVHRDVVSFNSKTFLSHIFVCFHIKERLKKNDDEAASSSAAFSSA